MVLNRGSNLAGRKAFHPEGRNLEQVGVPETDAPAKSPTKRCRRAPA
jgi:hypothetical protein